MFKKFIVFTVLLLAGISLQAKQPVKKTKKEKSEYAHKMVRKYRYLYTNKYFLRATYDYRRIVQAKLYWWIKECSRLMKK